MKTAARKKKNIQQQDENEITHTNLNLKRIL